MCCCWCVPCIDLVSQLLMWHAETAKECTLYTWSLYEAVHDLWMFTDKKQTTYKIFLSPEMLPWNSVYLINLAFPLQNHKSMYISFTKLSRFPLCSLQPILEMFVNATNKMQSVEFNYLQAHYTSLHHEWSIKQLHHSWKSHMPWTLHVCNNSNTRINLFEFFFRKAAVTQTT